MRPFSLLLVSSLALAVLPGVLRAQSDSASAVRRRAEVRVLVRRDSLPIERALVRSGSAAALTATDGIATLRLLPGTYTIVATKLGLAPDTIIAMIGTRDTMLVANLAELSAELDEVVVSSTRADRRVEDEPLRVEVLSREEVEEKLLMTPGDISMMLNETSGLRVQTTSPSLGGANVRVQGLRGRYTQVLSDGLPLFGGQTGSLGLLQIPPMDLGQVEVIKGAASALYGASALGGVINLVSRRPERARELLLNQTTRQGTDVVAYLAEPGDEGRGSSLLTGYHRQQAVDVQGDGWADLPGYDRIVIRPRGFWSNGANVNALVTAGATLEDRTGGTLKGRFAPSGAAFVEGLRTERYDAGAIGRALVRSDVFALRGSVTQQRHRHRFGAVEENDRHLTGFGELSWTRGWATHTLVLGAAMAYDQYRARELPPFDYSHIVPGIFAQEEYAPVDWLAFAATARLDRHSQYGAALSPRFSALLRPKGWTVRASVGSGFFGPTPFTEEVEVVGLSRLRVPQRLVAERARSASLDVGRVFGPLELNATAFASEIVHPVATQALPGDSLTLVNASEPTRTKGGELLARLRCEPFAVTATYALLESRELDVETRQRVDVALTPRQTASLVAVVEQHGVGRVGLEVYYTGTQRLEENPYRARAPAYVLVGLLAERRFGALRLFVNLENLGDVRQTRYDPLLLSAPGRGGRWTTDVWAPLEGRTINGGVRANF
jgi:outer membrane receptor for ferrienterochelin and colicins